MQRRIVVLGGVFLFLAAVSVRAQHYVEYGVNLSLGPTHYIEHYEQGPAPLGPIIEEDVIDGYGRVAGVANVGFGVNKARVDLAGTNPDNPFFFEYGFASSRYFDTFQFDDPELDGTHGFFDVTLYVAGSGAVNLSDGYLLSPDTMLDAFWHAVINVSVDGVLDPEGSPIQSVYYAGQWFKDLETTWLDYYGDPLNTYQQTATIEFIYGQPIFMDTFLQVDTYFDNQTSSVAGTLDSVLDLGNSSYWGGIKNLRDAQGQPVIHAGYSSSSGFDYRLSAVPATLPSLTQADGGLARNRYLAVSVPAEVGPTALRVVLTSLMHPNAPNASSPDFTAFENQVRWVGAPKDCFAGDATGSKCAALQCTPYYADWFATLGGRTLQVTGAEVVSSSAYDVQHVSIACQGNEANCVSVSAPLRVSTSLWGDVTAPVNAVGFMDVSAVVRCFMGSTSAPPRSACDLYPAIPDQVINFQDVSSCVEAFKGRAYPYSGPSACP